MENTENTLETAIRARIAELRAEAAEIPMKANLEIVAFRARMQERVAVLQDEAQRLEALLPAETENC